MVTLINVVTLHWARLVLGWVTILEQLTPQHRTRHPGLLARDANVREI